MPELGTLGRRAAAGLAGLAPWTRQSGQWKGKSFISGGRKIVRTALYMGALVAAQHNQTLKAFRNRPVADGKPKTLAIIAVARKLLTIRCNPERQPSMAAPKHLTKKTVAKVLIDQADIKSAGVVAPRARTQGARTREVIACGAAGARSEKHEKCGGSFRAGLPAAP